VGSGTTWHAARRYVTPVAEGGLMMPGDSLPTFRTAPLPPGVQLKLWEDCTCDYRPPQVAGRAVPRKSDPAWAEWTEDPPRTASTKQSLRLALARKPKRDDPGGLLGPNFYALGHFHSGDARREQPGFPDLPIWSPRGREMWELKAMGEVPTLPQAVHMTSLELAGYTVRTVRPCCLLSGWVDRWLAELAGVEPTLSPWAPLTGHAERAIAAVRSLRTGGFADGPAAFAGAPGTVTVAASLPAQRRLQLVPAPPGRDVDDDAIAAAGHAVGYLVPMPVDVDRADVTGLEGWLRAHGFAPTDVPWPMRLVVAGSLLLVWANTGERSPGPGQPRPRAWRMASLEQPAPEDLIFKLGGETLTAATAPALLGSLLRASPSVAATC
jgi:hypothetical protein